MGFLATDYSYDPTGRMTAKHYQANSHYNQSTYAEYMYKPFNYDYNANGALQKITYATGRRVYYCYGSDPSRPYAIRSSDSSDITSCSGGSAIASNITYYPFGDIKGMSLADGQTQSFTRDKRYALQEMTDGYSGNLTAYHDLQYSYDSFGDISTIADGRTAVGQYPNYTSLGYDNLHQLTSAGISIYNGNPTATTYTEAFTYDSAGNRTQYTKNGTAQNYSYTSGTNKLASISGGKSVSLSYDNRGSMTLYSETLPGGTVVNGDGYYSPSGLLYAKDDYLQHGSTVVYGNSIDLGIMPNGEMVGKINASTGELRIFASDPAGNQIFEGFHTDSTTQSPVIEHIYLGNRIIATITGAGDACFIATVAYGSPLAEDLNVYRAFRDRVLKRFAFGQDFVHYYYARGPAAAKWVKQHDRARMATRWVLTVVAVPLKIILFGRLSLFITLAVVLLCAFVVMKKLGWKRSTALTVTFALAFSTVFVYYFFVEVPVAQATYTENAKYFYTIDHIGRPLNLRDSSLNLRWYEQHYSFGEIITEAVPNGTIYAGSGSYQLAWTPPFRFPGQYESDDMDLAGSNPPGEEFLVQNHYREYMPILGRYQRLDPLENIIKLNSFNYINPNSIELNNAINTTAKNYNYVANPFSSTDDYGLLIQSCINGCQASCNATRLTCNRTCACKYGLMFDKVNECQNRCDYSFIWCEIKCYLCCISTLGLGGIGRWCY